MNYYIGNIFMKKIYALLIAVVLLSSCSDQNIKKTTLTEAPVVKTVTAAFKSAEWIFEDEWNLIFRRLDNCQYIVFSSNAQSLSSLPYRFITMIKDEIKANPDYLNLMFQITYMTKTLPAPATGIMTEQNIITSIEQIKSGKFNIAGIKNDLEAHDFILSLKEFVKEDNVSKISSMISFPLKVYVNRKKMTIKNDWSFIKYYNQIFNTKVKASIIHQPLADIFANSKGLMIGRGEIWINMVSGRILITAINNI